MAEVKKKTVKTEKTTKSVEKEVKKAEKKAVKKEAKKVKELIETEAIAEAIVEAEKQIEAEETSVNAKAGKRSSKAVKEVEEKEAKESRKKTLQEEPETKPKKVQKPTRTRLERRSKAYKKAQEAIDKSKTYELKEALETAVKTNSVKFDATVELHINLNVDPRQADQNIRGTVVLPAGTGKTSRVAVFADDDEVKKAKSAGADIAANDDFLKLLDKGTLDFDILIATPSNMAKLGKYARLLGPKGLMPNPKSGTVTTDIVKAVSEAKAGKVEYRVDSTGIIHVGVGKVSFGETKLEQNSQAIISSIKAAKPATIKGVYIKSAFLNTTMGPSIKFQI